MRYVYIKRSQFGKFIEFNEPLTPDLYNNLGETWMDYLNNKWVLLSSELIAFHEENPTASVSEVFNMQLNPEPVVPERTLEMAKREKLRRIDAYDSSSSVNAFILNENNEGWFTPEERSNYRSSIDAAKLLGIQTLSFYVGDTLITVSTALAEQMLAQVQLYADQCFIVTKQHKAAVEALETIEAVDNYDITSGYPEKLMFTI